MSVAHGPLDAPLLHREFEDLGWDRPLHPVVVVGIVAAIAAIVAVYALWRYRRGRGSVTADGVPDLLLDREDHDVHHIDGAHVQSASVARVRMPSSPSVRVARGSVPPPMSGIVSGELVMLDSAPAEPSVPTAVTTVTDDSLRSN